MIHYKSNMLNLEKKDFIESTIKDRKNPAFKEFVKISPTLLISSLSILNYVYTDSEYSVSE